MGWLKPKNQLTLLSLSTVSRLLESVLAVAMVNSDEKFQIADFGQRKPKGRLAALNESLDNTTKALNRKQGKCFQGRWVDWFGRCLAKLERLVAKL
jgi:hypothetical protein